MRIVAKDPDAYVAAVDPARRPHLETLRGLVKKAVPGATEGIDWGMIVYAYDGRPFAGLASQKNAMSLYLMDLYTQPGLREKHADALAGLDMGKSCIRFRDVAQLPLKTLSAILSEATRVSVTTGTMAKTTGARKTEKKFPKKTAKKKSRA